jgi:hypothetical protein
MAATSAVVTANFSYPVLTELGTTNTDPTFETLQVVQAQLNVNAASIHFERGDGVNGHPALMITPSDYTLRSINHVAFAPPMNPPDVPEHTADATSAQIDEDIRAREHQRHDVNHYHNVEKTLCNQLIAAVPTIYVTALHYPAITFGNTTTLELLVHLHDTYGGIIETALDRNTDTAKAQWQPPVAIEIMLLQIEEGMFFFLAGYEIMLTNHGRYPRRTSRLPTRTTKTTTWE